MKQPEVGQVEQRLAAVLEKERREAIGYTVLTVLCTPAFVALASLTMFLVFAHVFQYKRDSLDPSSVYMGLNFFLAYMLVFVLRQSNPPDEPHEFDKMWLAGVVVFLVLLILTYATPLREALPVFFGIVCTIMSFSVLGLLGRVQMPSPPTEDFEHRNFVVLLVLAVSGSKEKMSIRVSDHPFIQMLTEYVTLPLYSTSANISGTEYINDPDAIYSIFSDKIDFMIDDGRLPESLPSTVVDVSGDEGITVIREGAVSADKIMEVIKP